MITQPTFTKLHNELASPLKASFTYYERGQDGEFDVPSLGYAGNDWKDRHFSVDDSGLTFGEDIVDMADENGQFFLFQGDGRNYETFDDMPSILGEVMGSDHHNAHAVHGQLEKMADGTPNYLLLSIYWKG